MQARPQSRFGSRRLSTIIGAAALASCGSDGFGCGELGVGPCGPPVQIEVTIDVAAADFNGDGRPDVALAVDEGANTPGVAAVYEHGPASGQGYLSRVDYPAGVSFPSRMVAADLDGDGRPDLLLLTSESASSMVAVLLNSSGKPGSFGAPQLLSVPFANDVAVADLDGDGRSDLIIAGSTLMVALQNAGAPGTFAAPATLYSGSGAGFVAVAVGDLDGDGSPEVAVADELGVSVLFLAPGAATPAVASAARIYSNAVPGPNTGQNAVAIADVDGDGRNDLVVVDPVNSEVAVILQSHTTPGQFLPPVRYPLPAGDGLNRLVVTDLSGKGAPPGIVIAASDAVLVYLQNPARPGSFGAAVSYPVPIGADGVAVVDVDGDGFPDIVTSSGATVPSFGALPAPGVLYQDPSSPGHFLAVQDLRIT
ncbi:MAG TPA: VCBS repeat-containing protein [Steroidobacteraceae bacterium]|nr:VCBS repeat-containing protein [Steroidobacteraceae bacterium]